MVGRVAQSRTQVEVIILYGRRVLSFFGYAAGQSVSYAAIIFLTISASRIAKAVSLT